MMTVEHPTFVVAQSLNQVSFFRGLTEKSMFSFWSEQMYPVFETWAPVASINSIWRESFSGCHVSSASKKAINFDLALDIPTFLDLPAPNDFLLTISLILLSVFWIFYHLVELPWWCITLCITPRILAFLFKRKRSQYWHAGWKDENGKRINRPTKIEAKANLWKDAQRLSNEFEDACRRQRTAKQMRQVISDLYQ